ncbi:hypothetical protein COV58_03170 [Candidatus Roizmanbacteria bacterium CG11_big_fil_rev_8_21_14_0_20_36_8]|uniref:Glycosyl transferase family 1 domain-containing protein n=2 Tax=Candidatus Roizmaniibacteriota TaxID=1752723 RepID=A0A2M6ITT4_9BACT|nr:MAG: hypothetical protein COV58_03170 [Candidatus Roizmanbacteria bacterium CG11_big_fil_rev_8_21_14_0_20_36_8]PIZ65369.1 MAG: hypothetical protein COY14_02520 [Candidatus Roizmanbacteria bacterium CG_4_10_14_0_2_um_filter_36_9]
MKKIGIDARLYSQTGVGTYLRNLLHYLVKIDNPDIIFYIYLLPLDFDQIEFPSKHFIKRMVSARWHTIAEQTTFYGEIMRDDLGLMHFTYFSYPVLYKRPFIATVHDITPLLFKTGRASTLNFIFYEIKHQIFKYVLSAQIKNAKKIITPTQTVKDQLVEYYGKNIEPKIEPIYEGVNFELLNAKKNEKLRAKLTTPFFLYVGNFYPHKNVGRLVEAFKRSRQKSKLLLVGPDNMFAKKLKDQIKTSRIENIEFMHDAKIDDLVYLYKNAKALVNPSLSEGFGLPLIEAVHFGCPIIASNIPVFHELMGDGYVSFDPFNVNDIADKLRITNYERRITNGEFFFERMTEKVMKLYMLN